jgi:hypothetical protein
MISGVSVADALVLCALQPGPTSNKNKTTLSKMPLIRAKKTAFIQ